MPKTVNILQLQIASDKIMSTSYSNNLSFPLEKLDYLKKKVTEFLENKNHICLSNRKNPNGNEYFVLKISKTTIELLESLSIKRNEYRFLFESNQLLLNNKFASSDSLDKFINKLNQISDNTIDKDYEVIEG